MKIVVCVKRAPDSTTKVKVGADGKSIDPTDVEYDISPYDAIAVEHAVQYKENNEAEVVVVSLGSEESEKMMRTCLAMGADRGVLVKTDAQNLEPLVVASALAEALKEEKPDLLLSGLKAIDDDNAQVGAMVATMLEMPFLASVIKFVVADNVLTAEAEVEGGQLVLQSPLPCAFSIQKGKVEPRICSLINIRKAKKKELKTVSASLPAATVTIEKMELPPARQGGRIVGEGAEAVPELFRILKEEAKILSCHR